MYSSIPQNTGNNETQALSTENFLLQVQEDRSTDNNERRKQRRRQTRSCFIFYLQERKKDALRDEM